MGLTTNDAIFGLALKAKIVATVNPEKGQVNIRVSAFTSEQENGRLIYAKTTKVIM
jgi:hypothetical protein